MHDSCGAGVYSGNNFFSYQLLIYAKGNLSTPTLFKVMASLWGVDTLIMGCCTVLFSLSSFFMSDAKPYRHQVYTQNGVEFMVMMQKSSKQASSLLPPTKNTIILSRNLGLCTLYIWTQIYFMQIRSLKKARFETLYLSCFQGTRML